MTMIEILIGSRNYYFRIFTQ